MDDANFVVSALVRAKRYLGAELKADGDDLRAVIEDKASDIARELVYDEINSKAIDATPIRRLIQDPSELELVRQALAINWTLAQFAMYLNDFGFDDEAKKAIVVTWWRVSTKGFLTRAEPTSKSKRSSRWRQRRIRH